MHFEHIRLIGPLVWLSMVCGLHAIHNVSTDSLRSVASLSNTTDKPLVFLTSDHYEYIVTQNVSITCTIGPHLQLHKLTLMCQNEDDRCMRVIGCTNCSTFVFQPSSGNSSQTVTFQTKSASNLVFYVQHWNSSDNVDALLRISIGKSVAILTIAKIIGWIYFVAWSVSFYPQIWLNLSRRNVSGLSFDFLTLNFTGFLFYAIYNVALFYGPIFQSEYFKIHPFSQIPVETNDVVFAVHALLATVYTIVQCFIYEKDGQKVSWTGILLTLLFWTIALISLILCLFNQINPLLFISLLSYIKLTITLIKYIPQAYFNYCRKSTIGWSIGNVLLDLIGGLFSILQIVLLNYNFDDWYNITGNLSKFGLGLFSILFDMLFIIQHYILYRDAESGLLEPSEGTRTPSSDSRTSQVGIQNS